MKLSYTHRFLRAYGRLGAQDQRLVKTALIRLEDDLKYPSLRIEKLTGARSRGSDIWSARASRSIRITFERHGDRVVLRNVGRHDSVYGAP